MSKISLSGNASGTGTFTLASPNSSTDRTLTLPDGSGELYNQSNIVGTVSESSGVPTGAIIERGSNANGEFVKYADGTLICHINNFSTNSSSDSDWTFPSAFSTTTGLVVNGMGNNDPDRIISCGSSVNSTRASIRAYVLTSSNARSSTQVVISAIGRWF